MPLRSSPTTFSVPHFVDSKPVQAICYLCRRFTGAKPPANQPLFIHFWMVINSTTF